MFTTDDVDDSQDVEIVTLEKGYTEEGDWYIVYQPPGMEPTRIVFSKEIGL